MTTYYRFLIEETQEILEFNAEMVTFSTAERKAYAWAKEVHASCKYLGEFKHKKF